MPSHANQGSATISGTTTSARAAYPTEGNAVRVHNMGAVAIFVKSGDSTVVATSSSQFVPPTTTVELIRNPADTHLAAITASSTATVYFSTSQVDK